MKKYLFYGLSLSLGLGLTACSDSFLDREAQGVLSSETAFSSVETATKMVNALYDPLGLERGYATTYWTIADCMSGDSEVGGEAGGKDQPALQSIMLLDIQPNNVSTSDMFRYMYIGLQRCNTAAAGLEGENGAKLPAAERDLLLGQTYFMRAFYYFDLVRIWGPVPVNRENVADRGDAEGSLQVAKIYSMIISDLQKAEKLLLVKGDLGRATKGAALAYLAKVHVTYASYLDGDYNTKLYPMLSATDAFGMSKDAGFHWQKAYDYADAVIKLGAYSLMSNYNDIFKTENSVESIFEAQYLDSDFYGAEGEGTIANIYQCPRNYSIDGVKTVATGWGFNVPTVEFVNSFEAKKAGEKFEDFDPRLHLVGMAPNQIVTPYWVKYKTDAGMKKGYYDNTESPTGFVSRKHELALDGTAGILNPKATGMNWVIFRYADLLLLKAEAAANLGGKEIEVRDIVNQIRTRARKSKLSEVNGVWGLAPATAQIYPSVLSDAVSGTALRDAVLEERRHELGQECNRFFDVVRTGKMEEIITKRATDGLKRDLLYTPAKQRLPIPEIVVIEGLESDGSKTIQQNVGY